MPLRISHVALLALLAAPSGARAQVVPDTTAPWRYFPLNVGDAWELYKPPDSWSSPSTWHERREVVGDTLIEGERYAIYRHTWYDPATLDPLEPPRISALRFDTLSARVQAAGGAPDEPHGFILPCPLDAPFNAELACAGFGLDSVRTSGGPATVVIGGDTVETIVKCYDLNQVEVYVVCYYAGIGLGEAHLGPGGPSLTYARVGGAEYGSPLVSSAPPALPLPTIRLDVHPNPTRARALVTLVLAELYDVNVAVYDALGRRPTVLHEGGLGAGEHVIALDATRLQPGVYVVRAVAGRGVAKTRLVVAR